MVRQLRTGRFGQRLESPQQQPEQITPELIRENPDIPSGRFGRSIFQTRGLQERAIKIRSIRSEAINEAKRLEQDFFSQGITIQQAEEEFANVDPSIRQFIKTTPEVRRQLARQVVNDIDNRIANTRSNIQVLEQRRNAGQGGSNIEIDILEKQQLITELNDLRDEAESGAFTFEQLSKFASSRAEAKTTGSRQRLKGIDKLISRGIPRDLAKRIIASKGKINLTSQEAQTLTPQARQVLGLSNQSTTQTTTITRPKTINELVADGIPRDIAVKISSGQSIGLEEYYRLPKIIREQTGLTRKDFENGAETVNKEISAKQNLINRIQNANTFREQIIYRNPLTVGILAVESSAIDLGNKLGELAVKKGFDAGQILKIPLEFGLTRSFGYKVKTNNIKLGQDFSKKFVSGAFDVTRLVNPLTAGISTAGFVTSVGGRLVAGDKVVYNIKPNEKEVSILEVAGAGLLGASSVSKFLKTEVEILRESSKDIKLVAGTNIKDLTQAGKQVSLADFKIIGVKEGRTAFVTTKGDLLASKIFSYDFKVPKNIVNLDSSLVQELSLKFPKGRIIQIEKPSAVITETETAITRGGRLIKPAFRDSNDVAFYSQRFDFDLAKNTVSKKGNLIIGRFEGAIEKEVKKLKLVKPEKLSVMDKRLLKEVQKQGVFKEEADFFKGDVLTKDILKVNSKGKVTAITKGKGRINKDGFIIDFKYPSKRTINRGRFVGTQEEISSLKFEREFGLKEFEVFKDRLAFADVTFPKVPKTNPLVERFGLDELKTNKSPKPKLFSFSEAKGKARQYILDKGDDLEGFYNPRVNKIYYRETLPRKTINQNLRHELLHFLDLKRLKYTEKLTKTLTKDNLFKEIYLDSLKKDFFKGKLKYVPKYYPEEQLIPEFFARKFQSLRGFNRLRKASLNPLRDFPPRKVTTLRGITIREEIELPLLNTNSFNTGFKNRGIKKPIKPKSNDFEIYNYQKLIQSQTTKSLSIPKKALSFSQIKGALGLKAKNELKASRTKLNEPFNSQIQQSRTLSLSGASLSSIPQEKFRETSKLESKLSSKLFDKQITKLSGKSLTKLNTKLLSKLTTKQITKQQNKLSTKIVTKLTTKQITKLNPLTLELNVRTPKVYRKTPSIFRFKIIKPSRRTKKINLKSLSGRALTESFTARILNFKPLRIKEKDIGKALQSQQNIGRIRLKPLIIPNFSRRNR